MMLPSHTPIQFVGMPYVPGRARGPLRRGPSGVQPQDILLLAQRELSLLAQQPAGILVVEGAPFSHDMIQLRGFERPAAIITAAQASLLEPGVPVSLDGATGLVTTADQATGDSFTAESGPVVGGPLLSADGYVVQLRASVGSGAGARRAVLCGAEAIGLVRTEFLLPEGDAVPTVEFYRRAFTELCQRATPLPVTFRLLDLAADKMPGWMAAGPSMTGLLGLQGARLFGFEAVRSAVQAQLVALESLPGRFDVRVLIPYLVRFEELRHWARYVRSRLSRPVAVGAMAETPAAALDVANWLDVADFVALGCNDLMQCLFAADRDRPELRAYLDPYAPVLYRLLRQVARAAEDSLDRVQVCGVLPQLPGVLTILLGLGYRAFSVDAGLVPYLAERVRGTRVSEAQALAAAVCTARESRQVAEMAGLAGSDSTPFLTGVPSTE